MARGATRGAREGGSKAEAAGRAKPRARAQPGQKTPRATGKSRRNRRALSPEARRAAILAAALEEFTARGYEAARLDDVAKRAGIAKGTIYLYFADKEALFQELVRSMVSPVLGALDADARRRHPGARADRYAAQHVRARGLRHAAQATSSA